MATENDTDDDVQNNDAQQEQQIDNTLASTGDDNWDKLIDETIEKGVNPNANQTGKAAGSANKQVDPANKQQQQSPDDTNKQRSQPTQDQSTQPPRSSARKFGNLFQSDDSGNIYDTQGKLIAKQGSQRAVFHRMYPQVEALARERDGYQQTIRSYEQANEIAKREGLTLDEHGAALQMFAQYKKDPVKTLNTLLTLAEQGGRDVSTLRQSSGPSLADIRANIREEIMEAIKPFSFLTEQQKQQQEQAAAYEEVQTEYQEFIEDFPDAVIHNEAIANVMRDKNVSAREAYFAVRAFAAEARLDFTKPLAPQIQERQQQQRNPSGVGNNRRIPPMGGRGRSEETHVRNGSRDQADADDSWDSIIRGSLKEHGIEID